MTLADALRTALVVGRYATRLTLAAARVGLGRPPVSSTTKEGLFRLQESCRELLARLRIDVEVCHVERVPAEGGVVFMWNQTSHLDHLILPPALPRPFHSLFNNEVRAIPLYGRYMERSGHVWVDRTDEAQWRAKIAESARRVREGECVLLSPEGTRSWDGRLLPMKRGAFLLARQSGRPIVCVVVVGARDCLPRGSAAVRPGRIRVVFADPIPADASRPEERVIESFERTLREHALR
jgi:1-acyl-sn-glycerol-3-phosphate acyltransferase